MVTALFQLVVVVLSGSVALLADTIHNFGDAATAIPLGIAFWLARRPPSRRFPYGLGRVEDFAGLAIILTIVLSAAVATYEAIHRLLHPQPVAYLGAVIVASVIGFLGNEAVAIFRIRVGRQIGSAALVADGHHARVEAEPAFVLPPDFLFLFGEKIHRQRSEAVAAQVFRHGLDLRDDPHAVARVGLELAAEQQLYRDVADAALVAFELGVLERAGEEVIAGIA